MAKWTIGIRVWGLLAMGMMLVSGCETSQMENQGEISLAHLQGYAPPAIGEAESGDAPANPVPEESAGGGGLEIDGPVQWLDTNISNWPQTATLNASVSGGTLHLRYNKAKVWPTARTRASDGGPLNGNCWILVNIDGTWHAATFDWLRTGQTSKPVGSVRGTGGHIPRAPLNTFVPRSGERYGFMVSTPARGPERTINERSNISMVTWP
jgi:hypothetical protein